MIRGIRVIKRLPSGLSRDLRCSDVTTNLLPASSINFFRSLHSGGKRENDVQLSPTQTMVKDFNHVVNMLVQKSGGSKHVTKEKRLSAKKGRQVKKTKPKESKIEKENQSRDSFLETDSAGGFTSVDPPVSRPTDSALPAAIQQLMASAPVTFKQEPASPPVKADSATPAVLRNHVETFCITQPTDILLSSLLGLLESDSFQGAQITLHYLIERAQTETELYGALQKTFADLCEEKRLPLFRILMKTNPLLDTSKNILPFLLSTAVKLGKEQGHVTSLEDVIALGKTDEDSGKSRISKLGHQKISAQLKGMFHDRPHDLLHLLETNPELTHLVSAYVMVFSTLLISSPHVERQRHLWEKIYLHLSKNQPLEWYISHERLLRDLSADFWGTVISRKNSPTLRELRMKVRKLPPSQAIWIQATLMTDELDHANALVEAMLNEGFSATEEIGQHLVRLFTRDMDPGEALDVIDNLHKEYGTYISLHTTFFSHWCRTRNSRAVVSMVKVLKARDQMTREFYIQALQRLLKNGDFKGALYLADIMALDSETSNHVTAGEFMSACLYRGRQSVFPKTTLPDDASSDLMTEGLRYHVHVERFANYISKFNESRDEPTTRLPVHVTLRYLNELHKRGLYVSMAWYQYNLEMMQVCALTQPEVELFLRGLARLLSRDKCISADFDKDFADIIEQGQVIVDQINEKMIRRQKGLIMEEPSPSSAEIEPIHESKSAFSEDFVDESSVSSSQKSVTPPSYSQVFSSPYFQFETVKWGAIKSPKDPGSGVRILNMLSKQSKSYMRSYTVAEAIQHVATKLYISTPPSYRRLRAQTSFNMEEFLVECESQWRKPLKWRK